MATDSIKKVLRKAVNSDVLLKSRLAWVDYLKGIAIILVVYRHVLIGLERHGITVSEYLENANMIFFNFRMPLFFILSGIFITKTLNKNSTAHIILQKFELLIYPYLVWTFLQISLQILFSKYTNANRSLSDFLLIFYQPRALDQFWYLPALFNTTLVYILIEKYFKVKGYIHILLGLIFYFTYSNLEGISIISDFMSFYIYFAIGTTVSNLFFLPSFKLVLLNKATALFCIPVFIFTQYYYLSKSSVNPIELFFISLIGCFCMVVLSFWFEKWAILPFLRIIGFHSLYIYTMHVIFSALTRTFIIEILGYNNPNMLLLTGIITGVLFPIIFYNLFIKDNYAYFLFTWKRHNKEKTI